MYKKDVIRKFRSSVNEAMGFNLSMADAEKLFDVFMETIVVEVARGDEVRALPYGMFYVRLLKTGGKVSKAKLALKSSPSLDKRLFEAYKKLKLD